MGLDAYKAQPCCTAASSSWEQEMFTHHNMINDSTDSRFGAKGIPRPGLCSVHALTVIHFVRANIHAAGKDTVKRFKAQRSLPTLKTNNKGPTYTLANQASLQMPLSPQPSNTTSLSVQHSQVQLLNSALEPTSSQFLTNAVAGDNSSTETPACKDTGSSSVTIKDDVGNKGSEPSSSAASSSASSGHDTVLSSLEHAKAPVMADGFPVDDTHLKTEDESEHGNMLEFKETPQEVRDLNTQNTRFFYYCFSLASTSGKP